MSSENLSSAKNQLKGNLGGSWDILDGCEGNYTDLGVARRFGGAAAAYSLRDIGAMNGSVVRVRREPQDTDATINDEENFSASQVQSGALEDWVNGKLESILPCDVATAYQAYSLRKVKASYSGNAVRIRRSSDDIEVDVAFDSSDKVSLTSAITNAAEQGGESGSTSATDLNGFLNESTENFSAIAYGSLNSDFQQFSSTPTISNTAISGSTGSTDGRKARLGFALPLQLTASEFDGCKVKVTGTINTFTSDVQLVIKASTAADGDSTYTPPEGNKTIASGTTGSFEYIFTGDGTNPFKSVVFVFEDNSTFDISNLKFEIIEHSASVHTWYDQVGSNNVIQATAANQPMIAENGALLADGLKFDGSNDMLYDSDVGAMQASDGMSTFTVHKKRVASTSTSFGTTNPQYLYHLAEDALSTTVLAHRIVGGQLSALRANAAGDDYLTTTTTNHLITTTKNLSTAIGSSGFQNHFNATTPAESSEDSGTSYDSTTTEFTIGAQDGFGGGGTRFYDGQIEELIIYKSAVTTDNRFEIENNINNYYGLYNDENEVTGAFTASGAESFTANGTNGFVLQNDSGTAFAGLELNRALNDGEKVYISFNCTFDSGANTSPNFALKEGSITGSVASDESYHTVTEGFNSVIQTSDAGNDGRYLGFGEDNTDPSKFTISDFRVSLIARNGFVESWYDQSGNARTMAQTTAADQPHIVENGGICKDPTSNPTVHFLNVGTNLGSTFLEVDSGGTISAGESALAFLTVMSLDNSDGSRMTMSGSGADFCLGGSDNVRMRYKGSSNEFSGGVPLRLSTTTNTLVVASVNSSRVCTLHKNATTETNSSAFSDDASTLNTYLGENSDSASNDTYGLQGTMSELILYLSDQTDNITDIKNNLNNHYNIY